MTNKTMEPTNGTLTAEEAVWLLHLLANLTYAGDEKTVLRAIELKRSVVAKIQAAAEGTGHEKVPAAN